MKHLWGGGGSKPCTLKFQFSFLLIKTLLKSSNLKAYKEVKPLLKTSYIPLKILLLQNLSFVSQHFDEVNLWLNSKEFKDKYERENHPYPPLLDPDKLNDENYILNYEKIPAEKAWEMNLPLPKNYKFAFFIYGSSAHEAMMDFFQASFNLIFHPITDGLNEINPQDFYSTEFKDVAAFTRCYSKYKKFDEKGVYLSADLPFIILVRDPIGRIKHRANHGGIKRGKSHNTSFHLNDNIDEVLDRKRFYQQSPYPTLGAIPSLIKQSQLVNFSYTSTAKICNKEVYYIDASEVNPDKVMDSMRKYAKFFGKDLDEERLKGLEEFLKQKKMTELRYIIPLTLKIRSLNLEICLKGRKGNLKDYAKELVDKDLENLKVFDIIALAMSEEDFKALKEDEKLFNETKIYLNETKIYLNEFVKKLDNLRQKYVETYVKKKMY